MIFVETPRQAALQDVLVCNAQRKYAQRVWLVPLEHVRRFVDRRLDEDPAQAENILFVQSTGRCGSTLLSKVLDAIGGVHSLSEPDVYTQIWDTVLAGREALSGVNTHQLLHDVTVLYAMMLRFHSAGDGLVCLKLRSQCIEVAESMHKAIPSAKQIFMYRDG